MPAKKKVDKKLVDKKLIMAMKGINALHLDGAGSSKPCEGTQANEVRKEKFAKYLAERKRSLEAAQQNEASSSSENARSTSK